MTLMENFELHGWQIFGENKFVTMRIRFKQDQGHSAMPEIPQTFKKVSTQQAKRNQARAKKHHERTNMVTRSRALPDIEKPRDIFDLSQGEELLHMVDSPALPCASQAADATPKIDPLIAFSPDPHHASVISHASMSTQTDQDYSLVSAPSWHFDSEENENELDLDVNVESSELKTESYANSEINQSSVDIEPGLMDDQEHISK